MKNIIKVMLLLMLSCGLAGCFQVDQVVVLLPDGSGTVEETFMVSRRIAESMAAFAGGFGEPSEADGSDKSNIGKKEQLFFKDGDIRKRAEGFGDGVTFVRMERLGNDRFEGYKALYAFKNINKLQLDHGSPVMPGQTGQAKESKPKVTEFVFKPGKIASLIVKNNKKLSSEPAEPAVVTPVKESNGEELDMLRQMFEGLRVSTTLVIKGEVVNSNATYRNGSTITIAEIDFSRILDKPELLAGMMSVPPGDQAGALEMLKKLPGMKVDMNEELRITFK